MFLKLKIDEVTIKGRGCTEGRKQWEYLSKGDMLSTTVSTVGLMLSCMIDAMEGREVVTANTPGAFLQNDSDKGDIHKLWSTYLKRLTRNIINILSSQINTEGIACIQKPRRISMEH